ncbi:hypothetical protein [Arenimonas donghaensis]|uniref:hypothetical protein n=1 Tax=Arenimonas donghaensis TaxID=375061 RepID=UPI001362C085|nr:hypothetical protein [Arenimonas donghaensis]
MPELSLLFCLKHATPAVLVERLARLEERLDGHVDFEFLLVGYGHPDDTSLAFRDVARTFPRSRPVLHTRRCPVSDALGYGVDQARADWVVLFPELAGPDDEAACVQAMLAQLRREPEGSPCVAAGRGRPVLFRTGAFSALPRIPAMAAWLPELLALDGQRCTQPRVAGEPLPLWSACRRLLRRLVVSSLCTWAALGGRRATGKTV